MTARRKARDEFLAKIKEKDLEEKGELASVASSIVMKILYGVRFVRMDLLRIIGFSCLLFHSLEQGM